MSKQAKVLFKGKLAGLLTETDKGYLFKYDEQYLLDKNSKPVSNTLPLTTPVYESNTLHPFFDGLIPEGWLLDIAEQTWKLNPRDRMGLLLLCCKDTIGAVSIVAK